MNPDEKQIVEQRINSEERESSVIFDNLRENRTLTLLNIFGDAINAANRTSSVTFRKGIKLRVGDDWHFSRATERLVQNQGPR